MRVSTLRRRQWLRRSLSRWQWERHAADPVATASWEGAHLSIVLINIEAETAILKPSKGALEREHVVGGATDGIRDAASETDRKAVVTRVRDNDC